MSETPPTKSGEPKRDAAPRRRRPELREEKILLSHGSGGKASHSLIESVFADAFSNSLLDALDDAAVFPVDSGRFAFTTDSHVVSPIFFPGGNIGDLAVNGTINDLAVSGATPLCLSAAFVLEEGFPVEQLRTIVESMAAAASDAGVSIVTGDTKVVHSGKADGVFITTAGIGRVDGRVHIAQSAVQPGDKILLTGPIGDHGIAIMLAREELEIESEILSDTTALNGLVEALINAVGGAVHCMKDPTRGGLATSLNEIAQSSQVCIALEEERIPIREGVRGACEILGLDPFTIANEGKLIAAVAPAASEAALRAMRSHPLGAQSQMIGDALAAPPGIVFLNTRIGGSRVMDMLVGDPLPRIC
ncbi:MAG: hydrogenase expression/formation protein HypE [Armatimonadetes bacterium CG2_30_59_28]|nr:hydrogenase expression/formation protein HypE [Armatimonadota bacterium]OIO89797.1 MAG: hydrogenase expression/formation protein HypE [Armatimonadetes bacterium CG2_30_59_28]PIU63736.1 MAG: hydrogenase expression/formation protein HypE [Armatimonadetes bacterium CG07_land_8_20_14_0_80_59_28]PIX40643.1 MAG: hydrogenase expression/formation protein HypE [Armatimonadetes bacterium CG_4_8_14_3_um_filter_58_9]PIY39430.1 MAG: hydrogenase expression/formation protein HypE [Armatimonadetes bacterium